jgi:cell division protein FtsI (penicillin-binding protein 3)
VSELLSSLPRGLPKGLPGRTGAPNWRWLTERVWSLEHAFERARAQARPEEDTRVRIFVVLALFSIMFLAVAAGATRAALFSGEHALGGASGAALARADLEDRDGRLLAADMAHFALYLDPSEIFDAAGTRRRLLAALSSIPAERLDRALKSERRTLVLSGLTPPERAAVHALGLSGVSFEEEARRRYPLGASASHLIGFVDSGGKGLAGVERSFEDEIRAAGAGGQSFRLSIDLRVQAALEEEVRRAAEAQMAAGAVGVVTNVRTGEVLGMTSWPQFDANDAGKASDAAKTNRAAASVYEMGSTFKVFSLAAGLDSGAANWNSTFDAAAPLKIGRRAISDFHAENRVMTLEDVFLHSSNIGTSQLALRTGSEATKRYMKALRLLGPAEIELKESARPLTPRRWDDSTVASVSFGHAIAVSPLSLAAGMGAVLNGGTYVPLTLRPVDPARPPKGERVLSEQTSRDMLRLMRLNVVKGTGAKADAPGLRVGGKTGSADKAKAGGGGYKDGGIVSSFAAVFPTDGPVEADRYFVLVLVDDPQRTAANQMQRTGGYVAAPAAGRVIDRIAPFLGVRRAADAYRTAWGEKVPLAEHVTGAGQ